MVYNFGQVEKGKPLPKFGEWDVNNPASADGFTVIFAKARDEKKGGKGSAPPPPTKQPSRSRSRSSTTSSYDPNKVLYSKSNSNLANSSSFSFSTIAQNYYMYLKWLELQTYWLSIP